MEEAGVTLLDNHWVTLERQGAILVLVGIQDPRSSGPANTGTLSLPACLRANIPSFFIIGIQSRQVWGPLGANLVLSGHGHGGLVRLPLIGGLADTDRGLFPDMTPGSTRFRAPRLW